MWKLSTIINMVMDVSEFLEDIHDVVHPTYYPKGISDVPPETCASGRPIITTKRAEYRQVFDNGNSGYIVNKEDSNDLVDKAEKFLVLGLEAGMQMEIVGKLKIDKEFYGLIVVQKYVDEVEEV